MSSKDVDEWATLYIHTRTPSPEMIQLAREKRAEIEACWDRVNRRTEMLFALAMAATAWLVANYQSIELNRWDVIGCGSCWLLSSLWSSVAWWSSGKPTVELWAADRMTNSEHEDAGIVALTACVFDETQTVLERKAFANRLAAGLLAIGLVGVIVSAFIRNR